MVGLEEPYILSQVPEYQSAETPSGSSSSERDGRSMPIDLSVRFRHLAAERGGAKFGLFTMFFFFSVIFYVFFFFNAVDEFLQYKII